MRMSPEKKKRMKEEILAAMDYRSGEDSCNSVYVGSMAEARVYHICGHYYREAHEISVKKLLDNASGHEIAEVHKYLKHYIDYMKKHPTKKCPTCGQIMPA